MVYFTVRSNVADYGSWRQFFDKDEPRRRAAGATGTTQVYRDLDAPNTVTVVLEWNDADHARKFAADPALRDIMTKAGVIGAPLLNTISTCAEV